MAYNVMESFPTNQAVNQRHRDAAYTILSTMAFIKPNDRLLTLEEFSRDHRLLNSETDYILTYSQVISILIDTCAKLDLHRVDLTLCNANVFTNWHNDHHPKGFLAFCGFGVASTIFTTDLTTAALIRMSF